MNGRRSVWSNPDVIEFTRHFVPSTDEVWRLQREADPECQFFQKMADQGHFGGRPGSTRQGIYVCAPSGAFLGSTNTLRAENVLRMLKSALARWEELPKNQRNLPEDSKIIPAHRWEDSYPESGLVLTMFVRDLPEKCDPSEPSRVKWNRDYVWFSAEEARQWLPDQPVAGKTHTLPKALSSRLARFHLVDVARGQAEPMSVEDVGETSIKTRVLNVSDNKVELEVTGQSIGDAEARQHQAESPGFRRRRRSRTTDHGVSTEILGTATFDLKSNRFTKFECVALGARWGRTRFNGRSYERKNTSPLGYVFRLASASEPKVAPGFIAYYNAPWLRQPNEPVDREFKIK